MYEIDLSGPPRVVAGPVHLPAELAGLAAESLADLSAALDPCPDRFRGHGFWPAVPDAPIYDPETQRLSGQSDETPDAAARVVRVAPLVVNLTPAELAARDAARLEVARAGKIAEVNAERDSRYEAGFLFEGHVYQIDVESRTDMLAVEARLNRGEASPHGGYWRTNANQMVPMDDAKVAMFIGAAGDHVGAIKARSWALKDAAAVSPDPVAIDHTAGWPGNG